MTTSEPLKVDRTGWPAGPWDGEPDKLNWRTAAGLPGMIVRNRMGGLCGYVAVAEGHPWFGKGYDDVPVRVHGGLTYADKCSGNVCHVPEPGEPDNVWWLGFDCGHCDDLLPRFMAKWEVLPGEKYRDLAYVQAEVESLAKQLKEIK